MDLKVPLSEYLHMALASPGGIIISTNNIDVTRNRLYAERRKNPEFEDLILIPSPTAPQSEIWIVRKHPHGTEPEKEG